MRRGSLGFLCASVDTAFVIKLHDADSTCHESVVRSVSHGVRPNNYSVCVNPRSKCSLCTWVAKRDILAAGIRKAAVQALIRYAIPSDHDSIIVDAPCSSDRSSGKLDGLKDSVAVDVSVVVDSTGCVANNSPAAINSLS